MEDQEFLAGLLSENIFKDAVRDIKGMHQLHQAKQLAKEGHIHTYTAKVSSIAHTYGIKPGSNAHNDFTHNINQRVLNTTKDVHPRIKDHIDNHAKQLETHRENSELLSRPNHHEEIHAVMHKARTIAAHLKAPQRDAIRKQLGQSGESIKYEIARHNSATKKNKEPANMTRISIKDHLQKIRDAVATHSKPEHKTTPANLKKNLEQVESMNTPDKIAALKKIHKVNEAAVVECDSNKKETLKEATKHAVLVHLKDKNGTAIKKRAIVTADDQDNAIRQVLAHYRNDGFQVSHHEYHGVKHPEKKEDGIKEEAENEVKADKNVTVNKQKYDWGTMKTIHKGHDFSIPMHPEHHEAVADMKDGDSIKMHTEDGNKWDVKRTGEHVNFKTKHGHSVTVKHSDI